MSIAVERILEEVRTLTYEERQELIEKIHKIDRNESLPSVFQTQLGRDLWKIRQEALASGETPLSKEEIEQEITERRGGFQEEDV